jgi:predicted nuclease with TOPRIM domain
MARKTLGEQLREQKVVSRNLTAILHREREAYARSTERIDLLMSDNSRVRDENTMLKGSENSLRRRAEKAEAQVEILKDVIIDALG